MLLVDGIIKYYNHFKKVSKLLINLKIYLTYNPAISLPGIYPKKTDRHTHIITVSLISAQNWKEPKCPTTSEWINKV